MIPIFADTSFFVVFVNPQDEYHAIAAEYMDDSLGPIITTNWVLAEVGNYLSKGRNRALFAPLIGRVRGDTRFEILSADDRLFDEAVDLYSRRLDKDWSFTDCSSIVVML